MHVVLVRLVAGNTIVGVHGADGKQPHFMPAA